MDAMKRQHSEGGRLPEGIWLALDTSTASMTAALAREGRAFAERDSTSERNHSIRLMPEVDSLLAEANLEPGRLAAIAVGRGPGSYTGIRIGVTVAKMMAWSLGSPLYAVSSLEALAYGAVLRGKAGEPAKGGTWIVPLMDARRGKAYTGLYAFGTDGWRCLAEDGIRPVAEWLDELAGRLTAEGTAVNGGEPDAGSAASGRRASDRAAGDVPTGGSAATGGSAGNTVAGHSSGSAESSGGGSAVTGCLSGSADVPVDGNTVAGHSSGDADAGVDGSNNGGWQTGEEPLAGRSAGAARVLFVGDHAGFRELLDGFAARIPAEVAMNDDPLTASAVAALAWMYGERCRVDDPHDLIPNYTQLSEPEKKLAAKHAALKR